MLKQMKKFNFGFVMLNLREGHFSPIKLLLHRFEKSMQIQTDQILVELLYPVILAATLADIMRFSASQLR